VDRGELTQTHARGAELEHALELGDRGKVDPALVALAHKALEELVTRKVAVAEVELRGGTDTEGGTEGDAWGVSAWVCVGSARVQTRTFALKRWWLPKQSSLSYKGQQPNVFHIR
jgi:hypothetical protein